MLEIACGTGIWTGKLVNYARTLTAIDAAPEMIELARARLPDEGIEFVATDVFGWTSPRRFDTVFFAFWLSHVPEFAFERFWSLVRTWVVEDGRVVFVDEQLAEAGKEVYVAGSSEIVERHLTDGSSHHVVKVFRDSENLGQRLTSLGWRASVTASDPYWLVGEAWPKP